MTSKIENLAERRRQKQVDRLDERSAPEDAKGLSPAEGKCPICGRPRSDQHRPFCSPRCKEVDLGRWFKESYRVPTQERTPAEDDESES